MALPWPLVLPCTARRKTTTDNGKGRWPVRLEGRAGARPFVRCHLDAYMRGVKGAASEGTSEGVAQRTVGQLRWLFVVAQVQSKPPPEDRRGIESQDLSTQRSLELPPAAWTRRLVNNELVRMRSSGKRITRAGRPRTMAETAMVRGHPDAARPRKATAWPCKALFTPHPLPLTRRSRLRRSPVLAFDNAVGGH